MLRCAKSVVSVAVSVGSKGSTNVNLLHSRLVSSAMYVLSHFRQLRMLVLPGGLRVQCCCRVETWSIIQRTKKKKKKKGREKEKSLAGSSSDQTRIDERGSI